MDNIANKAIMIALSMILTAAIVYSISATFWQYSSITNRLNDEHIAKENLVSLMKIDIYDNKVVSGIMVADAILQSRSEDFGVYIEDKGVFYNHKIDLDTGQYEVGGLKNDSEFELAEITKIGGNVDINKNYQSNIVYDVNKAVGVIKFKVI